MRLKLELSEEEDMYLIILEKIMKEKLDIKELSNFHYTNILTFISELRIRGVRQWEKLMKNGKMNLI